MYILFTNLMFNICVMYLQKIPHNLNYRCVTPTAVRVASANGIAPECRLGVCGTPPWCSRTEVTRSWTARVSLRHLSFDESTCDERHVVWHYRGSGGRGCKRLQLRVLCRREYI